MPSKPPVDFDGFPSPVQERREAQRDAIETWVLYGMVLTVLGSSLWALMAWLLSWVR